MVHLPDSTLKSLTLWLADAIKTSRPFGENVAEFTTLLSTGRTRLHSPSSTRQSLTVPSKDAERMRRASGEKATKLIPLSWPFKTCKQSPVVTFQIRAVASAEAVTTNAPEFENAANLTASLCPTSALVRCPVDAFHKHAVLSQEEVTISSPSGEKTARLTSSACPKRICKQAPVSAHQTRADPSSVVPTMRLLRPENSPFTTCPLSSQSCPPDSTSQIFAKPCEDTVNNVLQSGDRLATSTGPFRSAGAMDAKVPSKEAVQHRRGVCMRETTSPSWIPASDNVM
mmetsp:Transcript_5756/g.14006  ORF Transcript_5756/g.14006 Transcript_5756/m.14006 type:complete len:285 (-) Transcript_5756:531-1385(-)